MHRTFTSSGLRPGSIQCKHPKVSRFSFPQISKFERDCLFSNPSYAQLSPECQRKIKKKAEEAFFAWMMSMRFQGKATDPLQKKKMYEEIVHKLIAFLELREVTRPVFEDEDFDLQLLVNELPRSCVSPFEVFRVTGVIPCTSNQITLGVPPPSNAPLVVEEPYSMPFVLPVSDLSLPSVPAVSMTFPPHSDEDVTVTMADYVMSKQESEVFFEQIRNPDVKKTLCETSEIHRQISEVVNTPNPDASLDSSYLLDEKYPGSPLSLIFKSEQ
jgi:hypothetical protein